MANARQRAARRRLTGTETSNDPFKVQEASSHPDRHVPGRKVQKKRKRDEIVTTCGNQDGDKGKHLGVQELKSITDSSKKGKKRLLRVPGMRPGETCFLCKGTDHIVRHCPRKAALDRKKTCLLCRERGHTVKTCRSKFEEDPTSQFCYNCGEHGHKLSQCKLPLKEGGTSYADCFVCKQRGHLSRDCPQNTNGIYPKGGCCKSCGGKTHLAKDCPSKKAGLQESLRISTNPSEAVGAANRILFHSGDELNDDFEDLNYESDTGERKGKNHSEKKQNPILLKVIKFSTW